MGKVISFPHLGNYYIVFNYFLSRALKCKVIIPPKSTRKTIELGSKYSPDFVCVPFKYNLGNYIEALDMGANVLVQGGGGCRYGYYGELQEKILRDLGYNFEFYNLIYDNHISLRKGYKFCKKMNRKCNIFSLMYYFINSLFMIIFIDKIEKYIRLNMGFEVVKGEFERVEKEYLDSFKNNRIIKNIIMYFRYRKKFRNIKITKRTEIDTVAAVSDSTVLNVDEDGDGKYDLKYRATENGRGELVDYTYIIYIVIGAVALIAILITAVLLRKHFKKKKLN